MEKGKIGFQTEILMVNIAPKTLSRSYIHQDNAEFVRVILLLVLVGECTRRKVK